MNQNENLKFNVFCNISLTADHDKSFVCYDYEF